MSGSRLKRTTFWKPLHERRGRPVTTTILDLLGALLLVAALALVTGSAYGLPAGLAACGGGLLVLSWLIDVAKTRKGGRK